MNLLKLVFGVTGETKAERRCEVFYSVFTLAGIAIVALGILLEWLGMIGAFPRSVVFAGLLFSAAIGVCLYAVWRCLTDSWPKDD